MSFDLRPGETPLDFDPGEVNDARLAFVGRILTPWSKGDCPKNIREARERGGGASLEIDAPYRPGLAGLEPGRAVMLLYWMDRTRRDLIVQAPRHAGGPRGVFSLRSPLRPNPVSLCCAVIEAIDMARGVVRIDAADCFDGTPLIDVKPWIATVDQPPSAQEPNR